MRLKTTKMNLKERENRHARLKRTSKRNYAAPSDPRAPSEPAPLPDPNAPPDPSAALGPADATVVKLPAYDCSSRRAATSAAACP